MDAPKRLADLWPLKYWRKLHIVTARPQELGKAPGKADGCPAVEELERYLFQQLSSRRWDEVWTHIGACTGCLKRLAVLKQVPSPEDIIRGARPAASVWRRVASWFASRLACPWPRRKRAAG